MTTFDSTQRGTGRTTRMIEEAINYSIHANKIVYVLCADEMSVRILARMWVVSDPRSKKLVLKSNTVYFREDDKDVLIAEFSRIHLDSYLRGVSISLSQIFIDHAAREMDFDK